MKGRVLSVLVLLIGALLLVGEAFSATPPCTVISNQATVQYNVGGVTQASITSSAVSFTVGVKVIISVQTLDTANVPVVPGTKAALKFRITNSGNATHDILLSYQAATTGTTGPFGGTDSFDGTNIAIYADTNNNGSFDDGTDQQSTTINDLQPGTFKDYFIVYNPTDLQRQTGDIAVYYLIAEAKWKDGTDLPGQISWNAATEAKTGSSACGSTGTTVDVVYGDQAGPMDNLRDAKHSAASAFVVSNATISISKTYTVVSDPINGTSNPKPIPGATIEYTITVSNASGGASATLQTITDTLPSNLKIVSTANQASWSVTSSNRSSTSGNLTADNDSIDGLYHSDPTNTGGTLTATITTILPADVPNNYQAGELKAGETLTIKFRATIE